MNAIAIHTYCRNDQNWGFGVQFWLKTALIYSIVTKYLGLRPIINKSYTVEKPAGDVSAILMHVGKINMLGNI